MRRLMALLPALLVSIIASSAHAAEWQRWTGGDDRDATLAHVLSKLSTLNGYTLVEANFKVGEDRSLANTHYRRYDQVLQDLTVKRMAIRVWTDANGRLVQLEASTVAPRSVPLGVIDLESATGDFAEQIAIREARAVIQASTDKGIRNIDVERFWDDGRVVTVVTVKARRGVHEITVDALTSQVTSQRYRAFPNDDIASSPGELSIPALVYPVYEEYQAQIQPRRMKRLKYIKRTEPRPTSDPFAVLRSRRYLYSLHDLIRGADPTSRAQGYWSMPWLKNEVLSIREALPREPNVFSTRGTASNGVILSGRFATINIHPDAFTAFAGITVPKLPSPTAFFRWQEDTAADDWEVIPEASALSQPLVDRDAAMRRSAARDPNHDPATYINSGFDEVQVYYAINTLFETLGAMGFTDPDLAERPFNAFLFDPDIEMQDNAYYTDDTINFTTYTPHQMNMARDNTTIWHELGHGVMDRLMGDHLRLNDTGGLSEGMADFVAEMVLQGATNGAAFPGQDQQRIINGTGFYLTNEVHDDGEAYGGAMKTILDAGIAKYGRQGLVKVTDLVLETMRFCRDHPELTADGWFEHMLFADSLGHPGVRDEGELKPLIDQALASRNFAAVADRGQFIFKYNGQPLDADTLGTRGNEIPLALAATATSTYELEIQAVDGANFHYDWPVEVRVFFNSGPLQGAIDWEGEDQEPLVRVLQGPADILRLPLTVKGKCDEINRTDGSCSDFAYVQLWNHGATAPVAKKRFYLRIKTL